MIRSDVRSPAVGAFAELLWADDGPAPAGAAPRERVLPNGAAHLVIRLGSPLRVFTGADDPEGRVVGRALIGGPRARSYVRALDGAGSVGAMLRPGALRALFGVDAADLADRHTDLRDVCGPWAAELEERLQLAPTAAARLSVLEGMLARRLAPAPPPHPAVRQALSRLRSGEAVTPVVERTGFSHRHFVALFRREVGLTPKVWARVQRMRRALELAGAHADAGWAEVAMRAGYADQAHLHRELVAIGGLTPGAWRAASPRAAHHVPLPRREVSSVQDPRGRAP